MNLSGFRRIHESNVEVGKAYFLKTRHGGAEVQVLADKKLDGIEVEITRGGFDPPLKPAVRVGQTMTVPPFSADWYESK